MRDLAFGWVPISKVEKDGDNRRVYGLVTNDDVDSDEQIVDAEFARKAMALWLDDGTGFGGNVRQQHSTQLAPAGKGIRLEDTPKGQYIEALIVEPGAVKLVDAKVYAGFSVGISHPRIVRDTKARGGRIQGGQIVEVSIVDRPANYSAKFQIVKMASDGTMDFVGKAVMLDEGTSELTPDPRRTVKRIREGAHVTIHARNEYGDLTAYEGIVTKRLRTAVALDCTRYSRNLGTVILADDDIEATYKGSYPIEVAKVSSETVVSDEVLTKLSLRIKNDSTGDIMAAMRRVSQWALAGTSSISDTDLERVYSAYAAEFSGRNPNKRVESFPATSIGKGRIAKVASLDELVDEVLKYNDNHDENGRFASGDGGGGGARDSKLPAITVVGADNKTHPYAALHTYGPNELRSGKDDTGHWEPRTGAVPTDAMAHPGGDKPGQLASLHNPDIANNQMGGTRAEHDTYGPPNMRGGYDPVVNELGAENRKEDEPEVTKTTTEANDSLADETTIATPDETKQAAEAHAAAAEAHAAAAAAAEEDGEPEDAADEAADATDHADAAVEAEPDAEPDGDEADKGKKAAKKGFGGKKAPAFGKKPKAVDESAVAVTPEEKAAKKATKVAAKAAKAAEIPYAIRKAHDWTCAAYKSADLLEVYPTVEESGITTALGEKVKKSLVKAMRQTEDAREIAAIGKALGAFADLNDETDDLMPARDEMNVAFKAENPTLADYPKPAESITPGQFRRPLITTGHADTSATAHAPRIPTTTHPVGPEDFTRGPLTDGQARAAKMMDFHDALSSWKPELCRMDSSGSYAFDRQPAGAFQRPPFTNEVPNKEGSSPRTVTGSEINAAVKSVDLTAETAPVAKTYTSDDLDAALSKAVQPLLTKITRMEQEYDELAASPDPNRPAFRGGAGTGLNKVTTPDAKKAAHKAARKAKRVEKIGYYRDLAASPDPEIRTHAQDFLAKVGKL